MKIPKRLIRTECAKHLTTLKKAKTLIDTDTIHIDHVEFRYGAVFFTYRPANLPGIEHFVLEVPDNGNKRIIDPMNRCRACNRSFVATPSAVIHDHEINLESYPDEETTIEDTINTMSFCAACTGTGEPEERT